MSELTRKVKARLARFAKEANALAEGLDLKSLTNKHVAYIWGQVAKPPAKRKLAGGNPGTTMPGEYFGIDTGAFYAKSEVAPYEASIDANEHRSRGEMPIKELIGGGSSTKKDCNKDCNSNIVDYASSLIGGNVKLAATGKAELVALVASMSDEAPPQKKVA